MLIYIDPVTKKAFEVHIHNFSRNMPNQVRVMGSIELNPEDKNYPDKKWVNIADLFEPFSPSEEFIRSKTI